MGMEARARAVSTKGRGSGAGLRTRGPVWPAGPKLEAEGLRSERSDPVGPHKCGEEFGVSCKFNRES